MGVTKKKKKKKTRDKGGHDPSISIAEGRVPLKLTPRSMAVDKDKYFEDAIAKPKVEREESLPTPMCHGEDQKKLLGERLFPLVQQSQPILAGKIAGMILELGNSKILHLLKSSEALAATIQEALHVLEEAKRVQSSPTPANGNEVEKNEDAIA